MVPSRVSQMRKQYLLAIVAWGGALAEKRQCASIRRIIKFDATPKGANPQFFVLVFMDETHLGKYLFGLIMDVFPFQLIGSMARRVNLRLFWSKVKRPLLKVPTHSWPFESSSKAQTEFLGLFPRLRSKRVKVLLPGLYRLRMTGTSPAFRLPPREYHCDRSAGI